MYGTSGSMFKNDKTLPNLPALNLAGETFLKVLFDSPL